MTSEEQVSDALRATIAGLSVVAALTFLEYFTQFNFVDKFLAPNRRIDGSFEDLQSTYPHRILLGYAMALGWVLTFGRFLTTRATWIFLVCSGSFLTACYLAMSRGPWLGSLIAGAILLLVGTPHIRKNIVIIAIVVLVCLISMADVRLKIVELATATLDPTSLKGRSYEHRWKLWSLAYNEVSKSPVRLLFGYGGNSTDLMDLGRYLEEGTTISTRFTSWDNQFASDLIEYGFVGFIIICCVLIAVFRRAWCLCHAATSARRQLSASLLAFLVVFMFAMTNVTMFAPQLKYLFWVVVSIVVVLEQQWFAEESVPFVDRSQPKSV